ncbi:MAG: L,D-transpeptidase family protein [Planctomycetes bacterium]|nr:L,D-transpeptidase family protein [Planctomycetota bacterium]
MATIYGTRQRGRRGSGGGGAWKGIGVTASIAAAGWLGLGWLRSEPAAVALSTPPGAIAAAAPGDAPADATSSGGPAGKAVPPELAAALERGAGDDVQGLLDLRRIVREHPGTPEAGRAQEALERERARALAAAGEAQGDDEAALRHLTRAWLATLDRGARRAQRQALLQQSDKVHFGAAPSSGMTTHTIAKGDVLSRVADAHRTEYRFIQRLNKMQNDRVRIGQRLKVPQAPVTVVIFKKDFELALVFNGCILRIYDVATGKDGRTPEASFTIGTKMVNPDWYSPEGKVHKFGSEENILGTRWLAFENTDEHQGFGIHGTKFPESIGTEASMGCIRMRNEEVEELYDLVPRGSRVHVVR